MLASIEFGRNAAGSIFWGPLPEGEKLAPVEGDKWTSSGGLAIIEDAVASNDVVVFSSPTCPFCDKAIAALKEAGYEPHVVILNTAEKQALGQKCGSKSVPKVFVKGNFVGGCNDGGMGGVLPLLENGKIKELMGR